MARDQLHDATPNRIVGLLGPECVCNRNRCTMCDGAASGQYAGARFVVVLGPVLQRFTHCNPSAARAD